MSNFDPSRAYISKMSTFAPFLVEETVSLANTLHARTIKNDTLLLVVEHRNEVLAIPTRQMVYHHIAQGKIAGEPWMISF